VRLVRSLVDAVDERVGDGLEALLCRHHARRLRRLGWGGVLTPRPAEVATGIWAAGPPVRAGNEVRVLVDGDEAFAAMVEAIRAARSNVHIACWHATPQFVMRRGDGESGGPDGAGRLTLRDVLAAAAERVPVRVLMWAGPPLPLFEPTRRSAKAACDGLTAGTNVRCVLDGRERTMHCHHEKLLVVDDELAFVGGLDFTALQGDRLDSTEHPPEQQLGWHDVATRLRGPIVADVARHFRQRWTEVAGEPLPTPDESVVPPPAGSTTVQLVRTVPEKTYDFAPRGEFTILDAYLRALCSARSLIYLENQFLWSPEIAEVLIDKLRHPPGNDFRVVLLLPQRPTNGSDTTRGQLARLIDADNGAGRLLATTISTHDGVQSALVYVHAKVAIVDDSWMTIGSANLNEHSLFNDTEVNIVVNDDPLIRQTRLRLWAEHLQRDPLDVAGDPVDVIDGVWRPTAEEQAHRSRSGQPRTHRLTLLPGVSRRVERLNGPLRGLLIDG
jgi:phosphatidylserine/phosphatidylglycerophosphate/cardiolipin synthase-like enzyme